MDNVSLNEMQKCLSFGSEVIARLCTVWLFTTRQAVMKIELKHEAKQAHPNVVAAREVCCADQPSDEP
jgi:hypothetical protein